MSSYSFVGIDIESIKKQEILIRQEFPELIDGNATYNLNSPPSEIALANSIP